MDKDETEETQEEDQMENTNGPEEEEEDKDDKDNQPPSLLWLIKKLSLMAKREAAYSPKVPLKVNTQPIHFTCIFIICQLHVICLGSVLLQRTCVFKFLGATAMDLGKERLGPYLITIITPLYRELDSTYADQGTACFYSIS